MDNSNVSETQEKKSTNLNISVKFKDPLLTEVMLKTFFDENEIYQYTISISQDYKEFKEEVISHLNFLDNICSEGIKNKDTMTLNSIKNYMASFLIRNNLIESPKEE